MKRVIAISSVLVLLVGCASIGRSPVLASLSGVAYAEHGNGAFALDEIVFERAKSDASKDRVGICLADNLHVSEARLSDASASFYGPASKNYYNIDRPSTVAGEQTLLYLASNGKEAVARGQVGYDFNSTGGLISVPISYLVRFTLKYQQEPEFDLFLFHQISAAQLNTGSLPNTGFGPLYDIEPLFPEKAYFEMEKVATKLSECLHKK